MKIKTLLMIGLLGLGATAAVPMVARAQDAVAEEAAPAPKKKTLLDTYKIGGWAMHPLLLCSIAVVGVSILNARSMNRKTLIPVDVVASVKAASVNQDYVKVAELAEASDSLFGTSLASGMRLFDPNDPDGSKPKVEEAISEAMGRQEAKHAFWLNFLQLITAVAPMLGLLGTVSGMIGAFDKIGMGGMGKPELLAANIGEAMVTTATGLIVAIPAMFAYFLFRNYLNKLLSEAEENLTVVVDNLTAPLAEE
ncbi:MAG TPA: MotA/TolQ/ExbB proton channel family protein [Kiritimatiellia bacterium]|nr:MotA/TolQ/ExbB proton channel family protein [Kiritimatiellia bacterium]HMP34737.1 MotA/TolQ/ExbB proton channel family protein [Kiritimatiellia bacterium]